MVFNHFRRVSVAIVSPEISGTDLRVSIPRWQHVYAVPFIPFYPLLAYAYYIKYDQWLKSEEWTFLACVLLGVGHALSFLVTRWSAKAKAWITTRKVCPHHILVHVTDADDNTRLARSSRRTAFASSLLLIAGREKSCPLSNPFPPIPLRTRSAINKTPTRCTPLRPSRLAYSHIHHLRTPLSLIIVNLWN
jgi:hypothetical protein